MCQTPQVIREIFACAELQLVNTFNNSIIFFLYLCHCLCLRFVKFVSVTDIINLMHGTVSLAHSLQIFNINAFSLLLKGELQISTSDFVKRKNVPNFVGNFFPSTSEIFEFCQKVARSFDWRSFLLWIVSLEIGSFFCVQVIDNANLKHLQTLCRLKTNLARELMHSLLLCILCWKTDLWWYVVYLFYVLKCIVLLWIK